MRIATKIIVKTKVGSHCERTSDHPAEGTKKERRRAITVKAGSKRFGRFSLNTKRAPILIPQYGTARTSRTISRISCICLILKVFGQTASNHTPFRKSRRNGQGGVAAGQFRGFVGGRSSSRAAVRDNIHKRGSWSSRPQDLMERKKARSRRGFLVVYRRFT